MAKEFTELTAALGQAQNDVVDREKAKVAENETIIALQDTTANANAAVQAAQEKREAARETTVAARRKVLADRKTLHELVDAVTADPEDTDDDGETDAPKAAVNLK